MKERIIENWLDSASERSFQKPFCYMLSNRGETIIHSTRHSAMELGKDVITRDREGTICVYQLKNAENRRIGIRQWRRDLNAQVLDLVTQPPIHPSIDSSEPRRCYLVVNGEIEEEVAIAIDNLNRSWAELTGVNYHLHTIVRGELLEMAASLENNLWPSELNEFNIFLSFFLDDGSGMIDKRNLSMLFESLYDLDKAKAIPTAECLRRISSAALLCALCLSNYSNKKNYYAEIEAWVIYISYTMSFSEKYGIRLNEIKNAIDISFVLIKDSLYDLLKDLQIRKNIIEGSLLTDLAILGFRSNILVSLMSVLWFMRRAEGIKPDELDKFIFDFIHKYKKKMIFWGEAAVPNFLSTFWFFRKTDATPKPDFYLFSLINELCKSNQLRSPTAKPNPYYQAEDYMPYLFQFTLIPLEDSFDGVSYTLEGLVHIFTRRLWKQRLKSIWPDISKILKEDFEYENKYDFYRWRNKQGELKSVFFKPRQEWKEFFELSVENKGNSLPEMIKEFPIFYMLFLIVYPHRFNADGVRWLDTKISEIVK